MMRLAWHVAAEPKSLTRNRPSLIYSGKLYIHDCVFPLALKLLCLINPDSIGNLDHCLTGRLVTAELS